ncbi:T9SS type A sorting domain-containing protein [Mariniflexile sp. HNIBRBA6329]|uniref:T9SS type A sorting domain-containing protein n=1 Tax=Mariniflexile sp. HNIBRBA6329 TaxID=3373088 RepID=UPI003745BFCB
MKQFYFLLFITFFSVNQMNAEACPAAGTTSSGGNQIIFSHAAGTSSCVNRPATIEINGTTTFQLDPFSCSESISVYNRISGPAIVGQGFSVTSGFDTSCSYSGGTLPVVDFKFLNEQLKVYPSPLIEGNDIKVAFGFNVTAKIDLYNVTGKLVLSDSINNKSTKSINISSFSNGVYIVRIKIDNTSFSRKIVILK